MTTDRETTIELHVGQHAATDFAVTTFEGRERLNGLYRFDVEARTIARDVALSALLGQRARLSIRGPAGTRFVHGIASRVAVGPVDAQGDTSFRLRIVPRLALLKRRKTSRIFQDLTALEIAERVAGEIGARVELRASRTYEKRAFAVQYQETDHAFLVRLLAEEGVIHWFAHPAPADPASGAAADGRETWTLADAPAHYDALEGGGNFTVRAADVQHADEGVNALRVSGSVREGAALVRGFDYEKPKFVPVSEWSVARDSGALDLGALRTYDHDRVLDDRTVGAHVARQRVEEHRARAVVGDGLGDVRRMFPGAKVTIDGHAADDRHRELVVTSVDHRGHQGHLLGGSMPESGRIYENRFTVAPASVAVRPKRGPRRLVQVTETATVVGPQGDEIHTDAMGRIKIQFHWDLEGKHDEHASCWIRVMQPWAGQGWGTQFVPRVGMEVVVTFTGGDTDRPIVLGCVYNGLTPPPFALPDQKTKSGLRTRSSPGGGGYNELSFDDQAGAERVFLHAERDFDEVVEHDHSRTVRGKEQVRVQESRMTEVSEDNVRVVRGNEVVLIEKNLILHVAGHKLFQIGSPPEPKKDEETDRAIPEDASVYAAFQALASLPLFEDANAARASQVRRSKIAWHADQLQGDDHRAGQVLLGRVSDIDNRLEGIAGAAHLLTEDVRRIPERIREATPGADPVGVAQASATDLLARVKDLDLRMGATLDDCATPAAPLDKLQRTVLDHVAQKRERLRQVEERIGACTQALGDVPAFIEGMREGGGGGGPTDALGGKGQLPPEIRGSVMKVIGPGEIHALEKFRISCGDSFIELTPGSIQIKSNGPVKVNGNEVLLNC